MGRSTANQNAARRFFVKGAGTFGKYLFRSVIYIGENLVAFLALTATIATLFVISSMFGITVPLIVATAESIVASLAGVPLLSATVALAAAIAAPETLKKIYKDCTEWAVTIYKNMVSNLFKPKNFDITEEELDVKRTKHPEAAEKYATLESYKTAKNTQYKAYDKKTVDIEVAGNTGKRGFKEVANNISDVVETGASGMVRGVRYLGGFLPSFSYSRSKTAANDSQNDLKTPLVESPAGTPRRRSSSINTTT